MHEGLSISERIARSLPTLTPAHQRMAGYVLDNLFRAATMRIDEFATAVDVSVATANRFARALGFEGYPQFRAELVRGFEATLAPVERLRTELERPSSVADVIAAALEDGARNLDATRRALDADACERAVEAILGAERVYIMGFGASGFLAGLLQHGLEMHCRMVTSVSNAGGASHAARQLFKLQPQDLVIVIAFPRYVADSMLLAQRVKSHGGRLLALTDGPTSPLAPLADIALYANAGNRLSANSDATVLALIEALCGAVAYRSARSVKAAAQMTEFLLPWLYGAPGARTALGHAEPRDAPQSRAQSRSRAARTDDDADRGPDGSSHGSTTGSTRGSKGPDSKPHGETRATHSRQDASRRAAPKSSD